jgi:hypothetical protein
MSLTSPPHPTDWGLLASALPSWALACDLSRHDKARAMTPNEPNTMNQIVISDSQFVWLQRAPSVRLTT